MLVGDKVVSVFGGGLHFFSAQDGKSLGAPIPTADPIMDDDMSFLDARLWSSRALPDQILVKRTPTQLALLHLDTGALAAVGTDPAPSSTDAAENIDMEVTRSVCIGADGSTYCLRYHDAALQRHTLGRDQKETWTFSRPLAHVATISVDDEGRRLFLVEHISAPNPRVLTPGSGPMGWTIRPRLVVVDLPKGMCVPLRISFLTQRVALLTRAHSILRVRPRCWPPAD